ncbi:23S rRNA (adenine(2503)-C(2))-methyltransferase RlmN [Wenzhouxiangella sp. AB-CW3]|uniref:23S rRNA (adenine(2503)-C(2))-methyltransferase RlmN n=1 Tax=Wenzhouxiangella sp. AB-CW3 TaxID=2771012 RepID=UPI00168BEEA9|nr:23S rRNA (adenine(2503)-C(2))-methyltransferase RlmN [Wenzhouxiangella sp. AB-CW3]QOC23981.1 23S rRNA (adenine(2503)-C(2))-methyltransferase RlmN [Wenzhouxiangella sp. AB-CW3]
MPAGPEEKVNLLGLDRAGLERFFVDLGEKPFRARQILQWIHQRGVTDFADMTDLSMALRQRLDARARMTPPSIISEQCSDDGTVKWLMGTEGGNAVETVYIPEPSRGTLCISSQVGCMLNCTFCSTATQGFSRNLSAAEIIGQVWQAATTLGHERHGQRRITNVVFMGMGEPMLNLEAVKPALSLLRDDLAYGLASRRVTISTAGVIPGIDDLAEGVEFALAVSLHAADNELRSRLVPLNRKYPVEELIEACKRYTRGHHRRSVTFEYTMIDGVNDQPQHARALVRRLSCLPCKINLIPFNPFPGTPFKPSSGETIYEFQKITRAAGLITTVRKTRGEDIDAACGQLVGKLLSPSQRRLLVQQQLARQAVAS